MIHGLDGYICDVMIFHVTFHVKKYYAKRLIKVWAKMIAESFIDVTFVVLETLGEA